MPRFPATALAALIATTTPALAEIERIQSSGTVDATITALEMAVVSTGASVFARIDHDIEASHAGKAMRPAAVLIFGDDGTSAEILQQEPLAGLKLPLRVLAYEDSTGQVWIAWEDPAAALAETGVEAEGAGQLSEALRAMANAAATPPE